MTDEPGPSVAEAFRQAAIHRLRDEFLPRLEKSVTKLDDSLLWARDNDHTNSVGHLLLHLEGNVRQWVLSGLDGQPDARDRAAEFAPSHEEPGPVLLARLQQTVNQAIEVIQRIDSHSLVEEREFQGFRETGLGAILHVVEHFSYHLGQISHMVKARLAIDLDYYSGHDLNQHNP